MTTGRFPFPATTTISTTPSHPSSRLPASEGTVGLCTSTRKRLRALRGAAGAGVGFEEGRRGSVHDMERQRDSPTPYLFDSSLPALSRSFSPSSPPPGSIAIGSRNIYTLQTPSSSVSTDTYIPSVASSATLCSSLPLWSNLPKPLLPQPTTLPPPIPISPRSHPPALISLLSSLFPSHHTQILSTSHALEIVTPPSHTLHGFLTTSLPRTAFIHLPPPHSSSSRPEHLSANFSEVLRPHDPERAPRPSALSSLADGLDIRESLTALLDLAADSLDAGRLVLILDKRERGEEGVRELVYSLGYAGGLLVRKGGLEGWEWDMTRWVMVAMEL